jgi:tetratricopeptide (TPR) repeat protein
VLSCPKAQKRSKSIDALKKCNNDPVVLVAVARIFERDNKVNKARKWLNRAISLNPKLGDAWIYYYALEYLQENKRAIITDKSDSTQSVNGEMEFSVDGGAIAPPLPPAASSEEGEVDDDDELGDAFIGGNLISAESELLGGTNGSSENILELIANKCASIQPNCGELWCSVSKETQLRRRSVQVILKTAAGRVLGVTIAVDVDQL